jgi:hypothetical protein
MLSFTAGEAIQVAVPFERDGEPFVPDANSVTWTLRGQDGAPITGYVNTAIAVTNTMVMVPIAAPANVISGSLQFEKRTLVVRCMVGGQPFETREIYRLTPWLNFTATPADVRTFCGVAGADLTDREIDLVSAYFGVANLTTAPLLEAALASGQINEQIANRAIVAYAVIAALPGLRLKVLKRESDGNRTFERFAVDFDKLLEEAREVLAAAVAIVGEIDDNTTASVIWMLTTPAPDPVTGE